VAGGGRRKGCIRLVMLPTPAPLVWAAAALPAAPTIILEQLYDQQLGQPVPSAPAKSMMVWPMKGTYCIFDGQLGHGVLDSCSSSIRATLLVNWWSRCPQVGSFLLCDL
jgi:hypothetical protein